MSMNLDDVTLDTIKQELEQCIKSILLGGPGDMPFKIMGFSIEKVIGEAKAYRKILYAADMILIWILFWKKLK